PLAQGGRVEHANEAVPAGDGQPPSVRAEGEGRSRSWANGTRNLPARSHFVDGYRIEQPPGLGGDGPPVRREGQSGPLPTAREAGQFPPGGHLPEPRGLA